jgi:hypothetical protein
LLRNPPNMDEHKQATAQPSFETAPSIKLPTRVITYAWGDAYVEDLLSLTIPALLAAGNLPYLASQVSCEVVMLTEERLFARVSAHPAIERIRAICPFKLIGLDDLITAPDKKYGMALTYALHRGFADLGAAMTDHWLIFLNADFVLAEGSLRNLLDHLVRGERLVASPSYCVVAKETKPDLLKRVDPKTRTLSMTPREMAKLALAHRHNTIRSKTVNQNTFHIRYMEQFYWLLDDSTLLGHQMPVAIVGLRPECYVAEPNSYWDHGLMREFCPTAEPDVIGDSDDFLMIELREQEVAHDDILPGWPQPVELAERMISWVTPYQRDFARYPLTLHAADVPANVDEGRRMLSAFVNEVMSHVPANLPSHVGHPQWVHHWTGFAAARYQFLSSRLGPLTESTEPPSHFTKVDQVWWKLDGQQKRLLRQRAEYIEMMDRQRELIQREGDLIQKAILKENTKELAKLDEQFLKEFTSAASRAAKDKSFAQLSFDRNTGSGARQEPCSSPGQANQWFEILSRYDEKYSGLREKEKAYKAALDDALEAVNTYYPQRIHAINLELERLGGEHLLLIGKTAAPATFPFLRMRRGSSVPSTTVRGSRAGQLARRFYYRLFGRWPRVSKLSPYWIPLRHLRELTEYAAERRAKDVLYIGERSNISGMLANSSGLHAWMSVAGLMTNGSGGTFAQPPQFDICLCDLEFADFARFSEIYAASLRFMRHGGTIIGFHLNADGAPLPIHQNEIGKDLQQIPPARVYYAGSPRSAKLLRTFRSTLSIPRRLNVIFLAKIAARLGLLVPQIWIRNFVEGLGSKKRHSTPGAVATSITTQIRLPEFPWDNGTVQFAKDGGVFVADEAEAPVAEDRLVSPSIANPPGTTVILTFGQSNAANSGEERYAARGAVHVFNIFDMRFYRAIDPLPGASDSGGSVWGRLGDKLIDAGVAPSVLIVPIAFGATYITDWAPGGLFHRRLSFALHRVKSAGIKIDMLCWHQGEADANHTGMSADEYCRYFRSMLREVREVGVDAPVYVALATLCEEAPHPFQNRVEIRRGQRKLISIRDRILPGPDTDMIGIEHRRDGCHFAASGQQLAAQAWFKAITAGPLRTRMVWARYRLKSTFAASSPRERDASATRGG